jgi:hypothetical protein
MPFENGWMPVFIPGWGGKSSREEKSGKINAEFAEKRKARGRGHLKVAATFWYAVAHETTLFD